MFKLSRSVSTGVFYPEIDGLRFFAILPVVMAHSFAVYEHNVFKVGGVAANQGLWAFSAGDLGVQIFFVISGYILGMSFFKLARADKKPNLKRFYARRLTRLEPPYIVIMTFFFVVSLILGRFGFFEGLGHYLASIFYLHNIVYEQGSIINTVAWTLEVEFQFYLLAPLLYFIYKLSLTKAVAFFVCLLVVFIIASHAMGTYKWSILTHGHFFILGAFLHLLPEYSKKVCFPYGCLNIVIFLMLLLVFYQLDYQYSSFEGNTIKVICLFVLFSLALESVAVKSILSSPFLYLIGGMCYSIYLLHYPLLSMLSKIWLFLGGGGFIFFLIVSIFIVLGVSILFFVAVERPFMDPRIFELLKRKIGFLGNEREQER